MKKTITTNLMGALQGTETFYFKGIKHIIPCDSGLTLEVKRKKRLCNPEIKFSVNGTRKAVISSVIEATLTAMVCATPFEVPGFSVEELKRSSDSEIAITLKDEASVLPLTLSVR